MLERYHATIFALPIETQQALRHYFDLTPEHHIIAAMEAAHLCQADLVLGCLRLNLIACAEALVGHPILHCPPSRLPAAFASGHELSHYLEAWISRHPASDPDSARRVTRVNPNPEYQAAKRGGRSLTSPSYYRYQAVKVGRSVAQLLARGVTRRDLREWSQHGWLEIA